MRLTIEWDGAFKRLVRAWSRKNPAYTATKRIALALDTLLPSVVAEIQTLITSQKFAGASYQYSERYAADKPAAVGHSKRLVLGGDYAASWVSTRSSQARAGTFGNQYRWGVGPDPKKNVLSKSVLGGKYRILGAGTITYAELGEILENLGLLHRDDVVAHVHAKVQRHMDLTVIKEIDRALALGRH